MEGSALVPPLPPPGRMGILTAQSCQWEAGGPRPGAAIRRDGREGHLHAPSLHGACERERGTVPAAPTAVSTAGLLRCLERFAKTQRWRADDGGRSENRRVCLTASWAVHTLGGSRFCSHLVCLKFSMMNRMSRPAWRGSAGSGEKAGWARTPLPTSCRQAGAS